MDYPVRNSIGQFPSYLRENECKIINKVISAAIARRLTISVIHDGEEWSVKRSADRATIQKEVGASDITGFRLRDKAGEYVGFVTFVHGNDVDVIHDHTDNDLMNQIMEPISKFAETLA